MGESSDWDSLCSFFSKKYICESPSLLSIDNLFDFGQSLAEKVHLVGYSMGGRLALWLHHLFPEKFSSIFCISAHPGLEEGREERLARDTLIIDQMHKLSVEEFIKFWYDNPLFKGFSIPAKRFQIDLHAWSRLLQKFTIAKQPSFWDDLPLTKVPILFLFGGNDDKYSGLVPRLNTMGRLVQAKIVPSTSHAVHLEDPMTCIRELEKHLENYDCRN